jgi:uncharacterized protein YjiS (DUF1127 family)
MTTQIFTASAVPFARAFGWAGETLVTLSRAVAACSGAQKRVDEVQMLLALSDEELSRRGIARDDIVRHVFRDLF